MTMILFQTRPNVELSVEEALSAPYRAVVSYFPKVLRRVAHAGRVKFYMRPFLPRYGFADLEATRSQRVLKSCPGVTRVVASGDEVAAAVIELKAREDERGLIECDDAQVTWNKPAFLPREEVRVVNGPFAAFHAMVEKYIDKDRRVIADVIIFGRPTRVEFDPAQLEKL